jgi:gamma-tubulin complex component 3
VSASTQKIVSELCELGWLYKKVTEWVKNNGEGVQSVSLVAQSLTFAIQAELTEYYRLLAVLDSQAKSYTSEDPANYLNLRKLYLWVQEPLERMKWLAVITDVLGNLKGGAICSAINTFVLNGSPTTKFFISRILKEVSSPILTMIKSWMLEGEINDPFEEFFVQTDPSVSDANLWMEKYRLNYVMIPTFLTNDLATKILQTGKAVNFIRRCCDE